MPREQAVRAADELRDLLVRAEARPHLDLLGSGYSVGADVARLVSRCAASDLSELAVTVERMAKAEPSPIPGARAVAREIRAETYARKVEAEHRTSEAASIAAGRDR